MSEAEQYQEDFEETSEATEEVDAVQIAFNEAIADEADEDDVKMQMISAGATFKNVTRLYNQYMIDAGMAISKADRNQIVEETLEGCALDTEEMFDAAVDALIESIKGATERSAAALVRAYGKKNELEVYAKPKSEGNARNPFVTVFHAALVENPTMDEKGLKDIIESLDPQHQVNPLRWFSQHNNIRKTVNRVAEKLQA